MSTPVLFVSLAAAVAACTLLYPADNPRYWSGTHPALLARVLTKALVRESQTVSINEQGTDDAQLGSLVLALAEPFEVWWQSTYGEAFTNGARSNKAALKDTAEQAWNAAIACKNA